MFESKKHAFMRLILVLSTFTWTSHAIGDYLTEGSPLEKIITRFIPALLILFYTITSKHRQQLVKLSYPLFWPLIIYIIFGAFCGVFSPVPFLPAWKALEITTLLAWALTFCNNKENSLLEITKTIHILEILLYSSMILALINPSLGFRPAPTIIPWLQSYYPVINPNGIGMMSATVIASLLFTNQKYKLPRLSFATLTLLLSQSRTSYIATATILLIFAISAFQQKNYRNLIISLLASTFIFLTIFAFYDTLLSIFSRGQTQSELASLSGRTTYWETARQHVDFLGGGFATGSRFLDTINPNVFHKATVNIHNSYLEATLAAGILGAAPYLLLLIYTLLRKLLTFLLNKEQFPLYTALAIIIASRSVTSIVLALYSPDLLLFLLLLAGSFKTRKSHINTPTYT